MKKLIVLAFLAISAVASKAQHQKEGTFSITPNGGVGYASMSGFDNGDGGVAGYLRGDFRYQLTNEIGFSAGLGMMGMTSNTKHNVSYDISYVDMPLLVHYNLTNNLSAQAGLDLGFLCDHDMRVDVPGASGRTKIDLEGTSLFLPIGLTWTFNRPFVAGLQVNIPVTRIDKKGHDSQKILWFMTSFGYRFDL